MPNQLDVISVLFFCKKSLLARHAFVLFERITSLLASERSERDTYRGNTIENLGCLFVYMFGRTYVILNFDPRIFVLVMWSTPSQIALNRILWFIDQYPYHPRN